MFRKDRLLEKLVSGQRLCDDCLSVISGITPRQSVNQACKYLCDKKLISRLTESCENCGRIKITNALISPPCDSSVPKSPLPIQSTDVPVAAAVPQTSSGTSDLSTLVTMFVESIAANGIEIYNEFSLQHELGIFLRAALPEYAVQFERNVEYFGLSKSDFTKREMDIVVFSKRRTELKYAIELKYPQNGQHPEQMFSCCKDIAFLEELKAVGFLRTGLLVFADDHLFYSGSGGGIYGFFRARKPITGRIEKPTGSRNAHVTIKGRYVVSWSEVSPTTQYAFVEMEV